MSFRRRVSSARYGATHALQTCSGDKVKGVVVPSPRCVRKERYKTPACTCVIQVDSRISVRLNAWRHLREEVVGDHADAGVHVSDVASALLAAKSKPTVDVGGSGRSLLQAVFSGEDPTGVRAPPAGAGSGTVSAPSSTPASPRGLLSHADAFAAAASSPRSPACSTPRAETADMARKLLLSHLA